jgi:hypothetical protein
MINSTHTQQIAGDSMDDLRPEVISEISHLNAVIQRDGTPTIPVGDTLARAILIGESRGIFRTSSNMKFHRVFLRHPRRRC